MSIKTSVYMATSLDGYIARIDGSTDWLKNKEYEINDDYGYEKFFESVDSFIVGRNTFESSLKFPEWPYADKKVFVLSTNKLEIPETVKYRTLVFAGSPKNLIALLSKEGLNHVYIDGGKTIQSFLSAELIDEMTITTIPILLGEGRPLFGKLNSDVFLKHIETTSYKNGFVKNKYKVIHK